MDTGAWAYFAAFTTVAVAVMSATVTLTNRATRAMGDGLRGELRGGLGQLGAEIGSLRGALGGRNDAVDHRIDGLYKDVAPLAKRAMD